MEYCCPQSLDSFDNNSCYCCTTDQVQPQQMTTRKPPSMMERQGIFMHYKQHPDKPKDYETPSIVPELYRHGQGVRMEGSQAWSTQLRMNQSLTASIPSLKVTHDSVGPFLSSHSNLQVHASKIVRGDLWMSESRYYGDNRGPILLIHVKLTELILTYKEFLKLDEDGEPIEAKLEDYSAFHPQVEDLFVYDEVEPFSATTKCKQIKQMKLKNQGTTAVRYQWLRTPPTRAMRKILGRPGSIVNLKKFEPPEDDPFFWKDTCFEFHFRELPGVILPGQSILFPIMFRPRRPGYFHEKLYLLTHPRLTDEEDRIYCLKLSGICINPECVIPHSKSAAFGKEPPITTGQISQRIKSQMLDHESMDILNSILDNVLYDFYVPKSTMLLGKITVEKIFHTHNKGLIYHCGAAEKGLENVRSLVTSLVPKNQIIKNEQQCPLSLQQLYFEITREPPATEYFWSNFKAPETEAKLEQLAKQTRVLTEPRVFAWPSIESRVYSSCYTTMVAIIYEIVARLANIDFYSANEDLDNILKLEIREKLIRNKKRELKKLGVLGKVASEPEAEAEAEAEAESEREHEREPELEPKPEPDGYGDQYNPIHTSTEDEAKYLDGKNEEKAGEFDFNDSFDEDETEGDEEDGEDKDDLGTFRKFSEFSGSNSAIQVTVNEEEILAELSILKARKQNQEKRVLFETLFGCGVERMMSVVDSYKAMFDYKTSDAVRPCQTTVCIKPT